jgi:NAD(P)-dependent dehydrogenase (short-subunit alcohol dehydrogenase family)
VAGLEQPGRHPHAHQAEANKRELDVQTFDNIFASNVRAAYYLVALLAPQMATRGTAASSTSAVWPPR